jgi:ATP-dependent Lon protease
MKPTLNKKLPVLPLRSTILYPGVSFPILVGRPISVEAVKQARETSDGWVILVTQVDDNNPTAENLPRVGVLGEIKSIEGSDQQGYHVLINPVERVRILEFDSSAKPGEMPKLAYAEELPDVHDINAQTESALLESLKQMAFDIVDLAMGNNRQLRRLIEQVSSLELLTHMCSANLDIPRKEKQELLETVSLKNRTLKLLDLLAKKKDELQVQGEIRERLSKKLGKGQREAILREQMKTIQEELGESETDGEKKKEDYRKKIEEANMPEDAKKVALDELKRLETIGNASPEAHVIRNYLDLLCAMPWSKSSETNLETLNLEKARQTLDDAHYGLDKIKKRILQHLAVMKLKKSAKGSILLFIGPPGVGKTSLGQSVAEALGRKFARTSLGGMRDDAEIRGHRRTYIGAMPGRIIQAIKRCGENDPVFMLDEIDKISRGYGGDPASAMLEVLDPEQNSNFLDHYLDVPFDLSKVFFIATANSYEGIPGPLLDRMEVIDLTGYTNTEKLHIAKKHLVPKVLEEVGLKTDQLLFSDELLLKVIGSYTREAGVRDLERKIATMVRGSAEKVLLSSGPVSVELSELDELLGQERFQYETAEKDTVPGVVTGLAWTPHGGDILFVETSLMPGSGKLMLTGQLGDVMKESAQIAMSLVRSRLGSTVPASYFDKQDLHIHFPAGAIPKDGPSAGVTMVTAIASQFSKKAVSPKIAMTGEITLRGSVTPVGGIKEKVLAAHRAGIETLILCRKNERDLKDVPQEVKSQLKFHFVDNVDEVLHIALGLKFSEMANSPNVSTFSPGPLAS